MTCTCGPSQVEMGQVRCGVCMCKTQTRVLAYGHPPKPILKFCISPFPMSVIKCSHAIMHLRVARLPLQQQTKDYHVATTVQLLQEDSQHSLKSSLPLLFILFQESSFLQFFFPSVTQGKPKSKKVRRWGLDRAWNRSRPLIMRTAIVSKGQSCDPMNPKIIHVGQMISSPVFEFYSLTSFENFQPRQISQTRTNISRSTDIQTHDWHKMFCMFSYFNYAWFQSNMIQSKYMFPTLKLINKPPFNSLSKI